MRRLTALLMALLISCCESKLTAAGCCCGRICKQGDRAERRGALAASLKASLLVRHILEETVEVPNAFKCPITLTVMREPAVTHEGLTYDWPAILGWTEQLKRDPKTAKKLKANHLNPNYSLRESMQTWIDMQLHEIGIVS